MYTFIGSGTYGCVFRRCETDVADHASGHVVKVVKREHKRKLDGNAEIGIMRRLAAVDPKGMYTSTLLDVHKVPGQLVAHYWVVKQFESDSTSSDDTDDTDDTDGTDGTDADADVKVKSKQLAMIVMTNVGQPLRDQIREDFHGLTVSATLRKAVGTFASLLRALAALHAHGVFHFDLNGGNLMVEGVHRLGRFIDFGGFDMMKRLVLDGNFETRYPIYFNPFDGLVLTQIRWQDLVAAGGGPGGPGGPLPPPTFMVARMVKEYAVCYKLNRRKIRELCDPGSVSAGVGGAAGASDVPPLPRFLEVHPFPCPDTKEAVTEVFTRNCEYWASALQTNQWGAFDVYALALTFADTVNHHCTRAYMRKVGKNARAMLNAVQSQILHPMSRPLTASRFTAIKAWEAARALCAEFKIAIPPLPPGPPGPPEPPEHVPEPE